MLPVTTPCILQYDNEIEAISLKYVYVNDAKVKQRPWTVEDSAKWQVEADVAWRDSFHEEVSSTLLNPGSFYLFWL